MFNKKGQMGEHGEQIFIIVLAVIIIGFLVTAVMIHSTRKYSNKAKDVGAITTERIGYSLNVIEVSGIENNSVLDKMLVVLKLNHGAAYLRFNEIGMNIFNQNDTTFYDYENHSGEICEDISTGKFHVNTILQGPEHIPGFIYNEDVIEICLDPISEIVERDIIELRILPLDGTPGYVSFVTPALVHSGNYIKVYP